VTRNIIRIITLALILAATIVAAFWLSWKLPTSAMLALSAAALSFAAGTAYWRLRRKPESEEADRPESNDASAPASPVDS
jgi:membrane protein implicated in regulation of membrane protease activity